MQALSASRRCTTRAHSPAGTRPPWRSRPSWFFSVQMIASTRCRSQFGKYRGRPVRRLILQHLAGLLALPGQLGVRQAEPGHRPVAGADQQQFRPPVPAGMTGAVAIPGPSEQVRAFRGDHGLAARDRGGVHQAQQLRGRWRGIGQPAQRGFHQRRGRPEPGVVLALPQQPREQGEPAGGDDRVGQFHVQCGQEGVQAGDHDRLQGPDVREHADPGHSSQASHGPIRRVAAPQPGQRRIPGSMVPGPGTCRSVPARRHVGQADHA
jgi:hypothetical protein